ncbi:hypothetical protein [Mechercharimyces sp. CAU 1602]|uniref:hypothetical protein n=1 Tax=Mechercharimyces sp. CAU 1602 TaxID=2973933 RepID=UPI002162D585|nr:hypothetical protein [Mechercharimyces sp. CAU 1602]MCS1350050.1 hypothetical protein [Mechercharimyces sp. CAU 1602]
MSVTERARFFSPPTSFSGVSNGSSVDIAVIGDLFYSSPSGTVVGGPLFINFNIGGTDYVFRSNNRQISGQATNSDILILSGFGTLINIDTKEENSAELDFLRAPLSLNGQGSGSIKTIADDQSSVFRFCIKVPATDQQFLVYVQKKRIYYYRPIYRLLGRMMIIIWYDSKPPPNTGSVVYYLSSCRNKAGYYDLKGESTYLLVKILRTLDHDQHLLSDKWRHTVCVGKSNSAWEIIWWGNV